MLLFVNVSVRQNSASGESAQETESSAFSSIRQCPVVAAFYENVTAPWSADKYVRLCSIVASSRAAAGGQRKKLVYTSTSNQLYIHIVNATDTAQIATDHVLLRYDGQKALKDYRPIPKLKTDPTFKEI